MDDQLPDEQYRAMDEHLAAARRTLEQKLSGCTLLEDAVAGRTTLTAEVVALSEGYGGFNPSVGLRFPRKVLSWMQEYADRFGRAADALDRMELGVRYSPEDVTRALVTKYRAKLGDRMLVGGFTGGFGGALIMVIPPLWPVGAVLGIAGLGAEILSSAVGVSKGERKRQEREMTQLLDTLAAGARSGDETIRLAYASTLFSSSREDFLDSYLNMRSWQQDYIRWKLHEEVKRGALPMDEQELTDLLDHAGNR